MNILDFRSDCPLNFALELIGDKWSLLIIRDIMFFNKETFNDFLRSDEKIATNVLRDRLKKLQDKGFVIKEEDPQHKQKKRYRLTQQSIDLLPFLIEILLWSEKQTNGLNPGRKILFADFYKNKNKAISEKTKELIQKHVQPTAK